MSLEKIYNFDSVPSFEDQFNRKDHIKVAGGMAEVTDISPEILKDEIPLFLAPSWGCNADVYKPGLRQLYEEGRRVLTINDPRIGGNIEDSLIRNIQNKEEAQNPTPEEILEKYPQEELRKALNILDILNEKNIELTDVIAHSEGAINTVIAATLHPEKFRNIVFYAPAGMIGEDTFSRLLKGGSQQANPKESLEEVEPSQMLKELGSNAALSALKYLVQNPVRSYRELNGIAESQIHDMMRYLHEKGLGIIVMAAVDDPVFPMEKMQEIAQIDMLDGFLSMRGGHGEINDHAELYMKAAQEMIVALEAKKSKDNTGV